MNGFVVFERAGHSGKVEGFSPIFVISYHQPKILWIIFRLSFFKASLFGWLFKTEFIEISLYSAPFFKKSLQNPNAFPIGFPTGNNDPQTVDHSVDNISSPLPTGIHYHHYLFILKDSKWWIAKSERQ
ncbi:hypothetical protein [Iodidimonas gelatinilytica]|uniref:hypothetical protein n=1 Tax=Iodidimonas gelatinilytica TaxID=1236966 RepID=UPI001230C2ED|nr:hypothetical protein [Iodidimonas gelatinilytica]